MFKEFLDSLKQKGIEITYSEGKIKYTGPERYIDSQFIEDLKFYRSKIIKHFWPEECPNLMPINTEGSKAPFLLLHGSRVNSLLSEYLGKERPFYGFLHCGSDGEKINHHSVESFAKDHVIQLQKIIPNGPYCLAGISFGGLIAYEMAVLLQSMKIDVPVLILIDTKNPSVDDQQTGLNSISRLYKVLDYFAKNIYHKTKNAYFNLVFKFNLNLEVKRRHSYIINCYINIGKKYKPSAFFKGEILILRATQNKSLNLNLGWDNLCDKVKIIYIEGNHNTIGREETAALLGFHIAEYLKNADGK